MIVLLEIKVEDSTVSMMRQEAAQNRLVSAVREILMAEPIQMLGGAYQVTEVTQISDDGKLMPV